MAPARKRHWIDAAMGPKRGLLHGLAAKDKGLTSTGTIRLSWLQGKAKGNTALAKRARCAITLKKMQARRSKRRA